MSIRSRISIPGGTCEFDLPAYYAWQQHPPPQRRADLMRWTSSMMPLAEALHVLLGLLRDTRQPAAHGRRAGRYQQSLPAGKTYHLLRVRLDDGADLVPEISGHRLMVSVRMMRPDAEGRLRPAGTDTDFELTLCADPVRAPERATAAGALPDAAASQRSLRPANPWRPFCSQRCRGADLGAWASEGYRVAARARRPRRRARRRALERHRRALKWAGRPL